jgi:hypothetical protein
MSEDRGSDCGEVLLPHCVTASLNISILLYPTRRVSRMPKGKALLATCSISDVIHSSRKH